MLGLAATLVAARNASAQPAPAPPPSAAPAETPATPGPAETPAPAETAKKLPTKLVPPDEARGLEEEPGVDPADVALFVPRAILFIPARVVQLVALPIREGLRFTERHHVIEHVVDFLYNDERTAAVVPVISLSTFFGAQIGIRAFHKDLGGHGETGSVKASWGTYREQYYDIAFSAPRVGGTPLWIESRTTLDDHPLLRFYGLGGDVDLADSGNNLDPRVANVESYYAELRFRQLMTVGVTLGEPGVEAKVGGRANFKHEHFARPRGASEDQVSLARTYDTRLVPGYDLGATTAEVEGVATLALYDEVTEQGNAFYGEVFGGGALPVGDFEFAHFGVTATGYIDLFHGDRLLVLRAAYEATEGKLEKIPFVELPSLGGPHRLRGYPLHRFRDKHAFVATVEYQYPIHENIKGSFFLDMGEVSEKLADLFTSPQFHFGGGGGLIVHQKRNNLLSLQVAGGGGVQVLFTTDPLRAFADRDDDL